MVQAADQQNFAPMSIIITSQLASLHVGTNQPTLYYTYTPPPPPPPPHCIYPMCALVSHCYCGAMLKLLMSSHVSSCLLISLSCTFICNVILFVNSAAYVWPPRGMCDLPPPPPPPPQGYVWSPLYVMNYSVQQPQYDGYCT